MFQEEKEITELREKWPEMSHEDKVDIFLWKMVWYHHTKHIPGSPPHNAINRLADVVEKAATSSEKLTKSIRIATWVGGLAATAGVVIALINFFL